MKNKTKYPTYGAYMIIDKLKTKIYMNICCCYFM